MKNNAASFYGGVVLCVRQRTSAPRHFNDPDSTAGPQWNHQTLGCIEVPPISLSGRDTAEQNYTTADSIPSHRRRYGRRATTLSSCSLPLSYNRRTSSDHPFKQMHQNRSSIFFHNGTVENLPTQPNGVSNGAKTQNPTSKRNEQRSHPLMCESSFGSHSKRDEQRRIAPVPEYLNT